MLRLRTAVLAGITSSQPPPHCRLPRPPCDLPTSLPCMPSNEAVFPTAATSRPLHAPSCSLQHAATSLPLLVPLAPLNGIAIAASRAQARSLPSTYIYVVCLLLRHISITSIGSCYHRHWLQSTTRGILRLWNIFLRPRTTTYRHLSHQRRFSDFKCIKCSKFKNHTSVEYMSWKTLLSGRNNITECRNRRRKEILSTARINKLCWERHDLGIGLRISPRHETMDVLLLLSSLPEKRIKARLSRLAGREVGIIVPSCERVDQVSLLPKARWCWECYFTLLDELETSDDAALVANKV